MDTLIDKETSFYLFSKNTKQSCILMCISLFIIIFITMFNNNNIRSKLLLLTAVLMLVYCLYTNIRETGILYNSHSGENDIDIIDIRKNIITSYILSGFLIIFIMYVLYTMIF